MGQNLKDCKSQSLIRPAQRGEQLVAMLPVFEKGFKILGDEFINLSDEKEILGN